MIAGISSVSTLPSWADVGCFCTEVIEDFRGVVGLIVLLRLVLDLSSVGEVGGVNWIDTLRDEGSCK